MKGLVSKAPELIREAARSPLGLLALTLLLVALIALTFFHDAPVFVKMAMFLVITLTAGLFSWKVFQLASPKREASSGQTAGWSAVESEQRAVLRRNLLANSAAAETSTNMVVRSFMKLIDEYSVLHFSIVREVHKKKEGITRQAIWKNIHGEIPRENSAEADLFALAIRELSTGGIVRQYREVDRYGNFLKSRARRRGPSTTHNFTFDDEKNYVLTELGKQFVHYTMNEDDFVRKTTDGGDDVPQDST